MSKTREIFEIRFFDFLNCESTCDSTNVQASIYDRKMDARPFDTTHDILCLGFVQPLFKDPHQKDTKIVGQMYFL